MLDTLLKEKYVNSYRYPLVKMCEGNKPTGSCHDVKKIALVSSVIISD